jgi:hypothetical protein
MKQLPTLNSAAVINAETEKPILNIMKNLAKT